MATVDLELEQLDRTALAVRFRDASGTEVWLPLSQITTHGSEKNGDVHRVEVPEWLADREGLT